MEFAHLKIPLKEIKNATGNFGNKVIGSGGFGKVYKGMMSHSKGRSMVAIKRLESRVGQGDPEFWRELMILSRYTHKNLISLLGFCDEDDEKILIYEYVSNGSLDHHLSSTSLTWTQRIKICLDVANGLSYLHDPKGTQQRVLHRDLKSSNILLDANWKAKITDMGLSKLGLANQQHTVLYTHVVGTPGYCDPQYMTNYTLTKESDIYSFGVVLFEVLCGKLCFTSINGCWENLVPKWKRKYKQDLKDIIFQDLRPSMNSTSLETFSDIAFKCLHESRQQRPTISQVVEKLKSALEFQEHHDRGKKNVLNFMDKKKPKENMESSTYVPDFVNFELLQEQQRMLNADAKLLQEKNRNMLNFMDKKKPMENMDFANFELLQEKTRNMLNFMDKKKPKENMESSTYVPDLQISNFYRKNREC